MKEFEFDVGDIKLHAQRWPVPEDVPIRAKILFNHGLNDHAGRYNHFFGDFAKAGYEVTSYDQRGQGRSVKSWFDSGATDTNRIYKDLDKIIEQVFAENEAGDNSDYILAGHSNGGGITLYYAAEGKYRDKFVSFLAIHPWVGTLYKPPPSFLVTILTYGAKIVPWVKIPIELDPTDLSNDPEFIEDTKKDKHVMKWVSFGQMNGSFTRANKLLDKEFVSKIDPSKPVLILAGKNDRIINYKEVQKTYDLNPSKNKTLLINDGLHEVFRQVKPEREKFRDEILEWLDKNTAKPTFVA